MNLDIMIDELKEKNNIVINQVYSEDILKTLMTISKPAYLSEAYYKAEKEYLSEKMKKSKIIEIEDINERLLDGIYIYKGDITCIKADAIVNAANEKLLGCFIPGHHCIDNAIHLAAGLGLRNACYELMKSQGDEPVGLAKVTPGFNLPSKYVIHTVGPNIYKTSDLNVIKTGLRSCYRSILDQSKAYSMRNVVICSISTGVYGVPIELASMIALETISDYLEHEEHLEKVVINVFSEEDYHVYKNQAREIEHLL